MNYTKKLADLVVAVKYDDFDDELVRVATGVVLDGVSNMLAGSREPLAGPIVRYMRQFPGGPCTVVGHDDFTIWPQEAAYINATFCHSMDYELLSYPPTHPTSPTLPTILALSQVRPVTGRQALEALVTGFEATTRLIYCIFRSTERWLDGLHIPGLVGPFGSAASAGKIAGLNVEQMQMAFGIAGSRVSGLAANTGTMTKSGHCANAARSGLEAALLAAEGYTANPDILGSAHGFNDTFYDNGLDLSLLVDQFGAPYRMVDPGLIVKKYPSQYPTHWSIDAALEVTRAHAIRPEEIARVRVEVGADNESLAVDVPPTGSAGKFSLRYTVAAALLDGRVVIDSFREERHESADMQEMLARIEIVERADVKAMDYAQAWSRVTVVTKDGSEHAARIDRPLGIWDNPVDWAVRVEKFDDCASRVFTTHQAQAVLGQIEAFAELEDVGAFTRMLQAGGA